jgi:hypothetical protein
VNTRQAYALAHPLTDPARESTEPFTAVRAHARGFLLRSILAVDR